MRLCPKCGKKSQEARCPEDGTATLVLAANPDSRLTEGTEVNGRYRIHEMIGQGGFGAVYRATNIATDQDMAIKLLAVSLDSDDSDVIQRFFAEAQVTASLKHPNTIRVFDFGQTEGGALYIAMELLNGQALNEVLRDRGREGRVMTEEETINIAVQTLRSLAEAHLANLVHRDLKPHNIFLNDVEGDDPVVKVLDFGIAKRLGSNLTGTGKAFGTPSYMSPEQAQSKKIDRRSDLYSLGVVLFQCIAGRPPFDGDNPLAVLLSHVTDAPPDLRIEARTPVSEGFVRAVERALAKNPDDRFATAIEMRQVLEGCRSQEKSDHLRAPSGPMASAQQDGEDLTSAYSAPPDMHTAAYAPPAVTAASAAVKASGSATTRAATPAPGVTPAGGATPGAVVTVGPGDQPTFGFFSHNSEMAMAGAAADSAVPSLTMDAEPPRKRRGVLYVVIGVIAGVLAASSVALWGGDPVPGDPAQVTVAGTAHPELAAAAAVPPPTLEGQPAPPPAPDVASGAAAAKAAADAQNAAAVVAVQVDSDPPGASVSVGGKDLGKAPVQVQVAGAAAVRAVLTMPGHRDLEVLIERSDGPVKRIKLSPNPGGATPTAAKRPKSNSKTSEKTVRPKSALEERL